MVPPCGSLLTCTREPGKNALVPPVYCQNRGQGPLSEIARLTKQVFLHLSGMPGLTVDARTCERGSYVALECADAIHALAVYELVMMADPHAELIHSTTSTSGKRAVKERMRPETAPLPAGELLDA